MKTTNRDLRVLICEDEFLLAMDMSQQLEALGSQVVATVSKLDDLIAFVAQNSGQANAAVLDVHFINGTSYDLIPRLEGQGIAVVICSGYPIDARPAALAHVPWIEKPAQAEDICAALCSSLDLRSGNQSV